MSVQRNIGVIGKKVRDNVYLYKQTGTSDTPRPLVFVLGWLLGKKQHVKKYTDIYLAEGCDVLQVQAQTKHLVTPKTGQALMKDVLELCYESPHISQPIFVHGLSAGIYIYGDLLVQTLQDKKKYGDFKDRLKGQIFDSYVDIRSIPDATSKASASGSFLTGLVKSSIEFYMNAAKTSVGKIERAGMAVKTNEHRAPTKIIYSLSDPLVDPNLFEDMLSDWLKRGISAECQTWDNAPHVMINKEYPEHFSNSARQFLRKHVTGCKTPKANFETSSNYTYSTHL